MDKKAAIKATSTLFLIFAGLGVFFVCMAYYPEIVFFILATMAVLGLMYCFWIMLYEGFKL